MTDPARHQRAKELFLAACERQPDERAAFLDAECRGDAALRAMVEGLLAAECARPEFLEDSPVPRLAPGPTRGIPERIGAFRIVRSLGEGGMGQVFEAEQENPRRRVALKVLRLGLASPRLLQRFEVEKTVLARLHHPGIAQIFEAGTAELFGVTQPYFAMEFVDGLPLTTYVRSHDLPIRARLELFACICEAVQHAHQKGVIHRDLKPANIVVTADGQPKVLDFGVARATDGDVQLTRSTDAKQIIGTLPYMSPEQASGMPEQVDVRSDVYGLGVILYELLTDRLPYDVTTTPLPEAVRIICEQEPRPIGTARRQLRGDLETIAGKALQKDKERRYASADALAADVRRYLRDEPIHARPAGRLYKLLRLARRNRLRVAAAVLIAALLAGLGFSTWAAVQEGRLRADRDQRLYLAGIEKATSKIEAGDLDSAREELESIASSLRDWEWNYLHARLDPGVSQLTGAPSPPLYAGVVRNTGQAFAVDARSTATLWDLATKERSEIRFADRGAADADSYQPMACSSDGSLVLTMTTIPRPDGHSSFATLWETTTGRRIVERFPVENLGDANRSNPKLGASAISPTGTHVALAAKDALYLCEVDAGGPGRPGSARVLERFEPTPASCTFGPRGEWLVYAAGGTVRFWGIVERREVRDAVDAALDSDRSVDRLALSPDRGRLATSFGGSPTIRVVELDTGASLELHSGGVYDLVFGSREPLLLSLGGGAIQLWDARTGAEVRSFPHYKRYGPASGFDASDRFLVTAHSGKHLWSDPREEFGVRVWNLERNRGLVLRGHESAVSAVSINDDETEIASGSFGGEVRLWNAETGLWRSTLARGLPPIHALAFDPRGGRLVTAAVSEDGRSGFLEIWNTANGALLEQQRALPAHSGVVALSTDGSVLVTARSGSDASVIEGWRTSSLEQAFVLSGPPGITSVAVSPDGSRLLSGDRDGRLTIWDLESRRRLGTTTTPDGAVLAVTFLSDRRVASGGRDAVIRIWDTSVEDAFVQMLELRGHDDAVHSLALAPDGERLVSGSGDGTVRIR